MISITEGDIVYVEYVNNSSYEAEVIHMPMNVGELWGVTSKEGVHKQINQYCSDFIGFKLLQGFS